MYATTHVIQNSLPMHILLQIARTVAKKMKHRITSEPDVLLECKIDIPHLDHTYWNIKSYVAAPLPNTLIRFVRTTKRFQ